MTNTMLAAFEQPEGPNKRGYIGFVRAPFDYTRLAANLASEAKASAARIKRSQRDHIIDVGSELLRIKEAMAHGHFTDWIDRELNFSPTTARNYMRASQAFADRPATVAVLPPATLYRLAGAPPDVRDGVVARIEAGEYVDREEVDEAIRRPRLETAEAKRAAVEQAKKAASAQRRRDRRDQNWRQNFETEQKLERQRRQQAATKLVAILAEHFDDDVIYEINRLWDGARFDEVVEAVACRQNAIEMGSGVPVEGAAG